ncbi:MAG TPA: MFS transporter [Actinomycetota bacterium]
MSPLLLAYLAFGSFWGTWVVVFADFLRHHGLTPGRVSIWWTLLSLVAILVMTFLAPRMEPLPRHGTVGWAMVAHAIGSALMVLTSTGWLPIAFVALGFGTGLVDVFVNAAAYEIEQRSRSPVLQWVHAAYGAGGVVGSLGAGIAVTAGASFRAVVLGSVVLQIGAAIAALRSGGLRATHTPREPGRVSLAVFKRARFLLVPALVVAAAFFIEGSMDVWSVIFLRETLGASTLAGAAGFAAFAAAITIGRVVGAGSFRLGYARTILLSGLGSLGAGLIAVATQSPLVASLAFLGLGLALASAAPAAYGMAEEAGPASGLAVGAITTVGYTGFVVGPPIMGWLADAVSLRATMVALVVTTLGILAGGLLSFRRERAATPPG